MTCRVYENLVLTVLGFVVENVHSIQIFALDNLP